MDFFRLRFLNTLLLFIAGIVLGFIIKERFSPPAEPAQPSYRSARQSAVQQEPQAPYVPETGAEEEPAAPETARPAQAPEEEPAADEKDPGEAAVIEPVASTRPAAKTSPDDFFSSPGPYEGRELVLELQMITARKTGNGWRLNLVRTGPGKKVDYLYVDDYGELGDKPDLRIGYSYSVRFLCSSGDPTSGNKLLSIEPTGGKADWATGLSAVE
ncbi:MAG: hypothetical protein M0011_04370 [Elusimicrobia bacterium]|nr:hypothetical protein [Elusimicrobiota bacterium]